jgi:hypothetical protein
MNLEDVGYEMSGRTVLVAGSEIPWKIQQAVDFSTHPSPISSSWKPFVRAQPPQAQSVGKLRRPSSRLACELIETSAC